MLWTVLKIYVNEATNKLTTSSSIAKYRGRRLFGQIMGRLIKEIIIPMSNEMAKIECQKVILRYCLLRTNGRTTLILRKLQAHKRCGSRVMGPP